MLTIYDGRREFYQWDLDQKLIVSDSTINEVHFCNQTGANSLVCEVYTEGEQRLVNVPNILLQDRWPIRAYAHCDCATKTSQIFNIIPRSKPHDYVYTETEVKNWDELYKRLDELELGARAIIDVELLPEEDINSALLYRTAEGVYWYDAGWHKVADGDDVAAINESLTNYVKYTDEPGNVVAGGKPGVVGLNYATSCGLRIVSSAGKRHLTVHAGDSTDVLRRNGNCVLTLNTMDERIKTAIVGAKENNENGSWVKSYGNQPPLTDDEKSSAQAWLGIPTTYDELEDKPFYDTRISLSSDNTQSEFSVEIDGKDAAGWGSAHHDAFLVSEDTYTADELMGAKLTYSDDVMGYRETEVILDSSHILEDTEDGLWLSISNGDYEHIAVFVAYTTNYQPSIAKSAFPKPGIYFTSCYNGYEHFNVLSVKTDGAYKKLDNKHLDLENHELIKSILSRLTALEK